MELKERVDLFSNGFCMTFNNGFTASVRWGKGLYCTKISCDHTLASAKDVEVAIYHPKGHFYKHPSWIPDHYDVAGYIRIGDIPSFLKSVQEIED